MEMLLVVVVIMFAMLGLGAVRRAARDLLLVANEILPELGTPFRNGNTGDGVRNNMSEISEQNRVTYAWRMTLAEVVAVYGNLERLIQALSNCGTLLTQSKRPRNSMRQTGLLKVSRNLRMYSNVSSFFLFSAALSSVRICLVLVQL